MAKGSKDLSDLLCFSADDREEMLRAALECYGGGQLSQAETILVGLMTLDGKDPRPVKLLASCLLHQDRHREAEEIFERAHGLDPEDPYVLVALGELKLKTLRLQEALPYFEKLFALDPQGAHPAANRGRQLVKTYYQKLVSER